jgi:hypothetical protein
MEAESISTKVRCIQRAGIPSLSDLDSRDALLALNAHPANHEDQIRDLSREIAFRIAYLDYGRQILSHYFE